MLEGELAYAIFAQRVYVLLGRARRIDPAPCHDASGADLQRPHSVQEGIERRSLAPHQISTTDIVVMMARITHVAQTSVAQLRGQFASHLRSVGEQSNLIEVRFARLNQTECFLLTQERLAASGDHQTIRPPLDGVGKVSFQFARHPRNRLVTQRTDRGLRKAKGALQVTRHPHWQNAAGQEATSMPADRPCFRQVRWGSDRFRGGMEMRFN